jgi:hypothetical protein
VEGEAMTECRICGKRDCDDDCEELQAIYREHQREKLRDIDVDEITCDVCGMTYGQDSHDLCREQGANTGANPRRETASG